MGQHLTTSAIDSRLARWVAALGLLAALAAMALPTGSGYGPEVASVLAVSSLALLAGHAWGLLIVALADVLLIGTVWPVVAFESSAAHTITGAVALAGAAPGLLVLGRTLPRLVELVLGRADSRWRGVSVFGSHALVSVWLVLPIF